MFPKPSRTRNGRASALLVVSLAIVATACSDSTPVETVVLPSTTVTVPTTISDPDAKVILGSGALPDTMPSSFPIPVEAVIGSTLIDRDRGLTEVVLRVPVAVGVLASFFDANLAERGYSLDSSGGDDARWEISLRGAGISGTVDITAGGTDVSQAVIRLTTDS